MFFWNAAFRGNRPRYLAIDEDLTPRTLNIFVPACVDAIICTEVGTSVVKEIF